MDTIAVSQSPITGFRERTFRGADTALNAAVGPPNGPPLVLFHGVTRCWQDWQPVLPELATAWQVIALDHRGHGGSQRVPGNYRVADFAADALEFLRSQVGEPAVLWGHSLGAMTSAVIAARAPQCVRALILEDPPGNSLASGFQESRYILQFTGIRRLLGERLDAAGLAQRLATLPVQHPKDSRTIAFGELRDEAALSFSADCLVKMDPSVLDVLIAGQWLDGLDWFGELTRIECPTLLLRADIDCGGMLWDADAAAVERAIARCQRVECPGLGHNLHAFDPGGTLAIIREFLTSAHLEPDEPS